MANIAVWSEGLAPLRSYERCGDALLSGLVVSLLWRYCSDSRFCTPVFVLCCCLDKTRVSLLFRDQCCRAVEVRKAFGMGRKECRNKGTSIAFWHAQKQPSILFITTAKEGKLLTATCESSSV